jgi:hypothetical protein
VTRGHIRKRGSSWSLVVDVGRDPLTNQRRQRWIGGFATRKEAQRALVQVLSDLDHGAYVQRSSETTGEFLCRWLESLPARGLRPSTLSSYRALVAKRLLPLLGTVRLDQLTPEHVNAAYAALLMSGRADGRGVSRQGRSVTRTLSCARRLQTEFAGDA